MRGAGPTHRIVRFTPRTQGLNRDVGSIFNDFLPSREVDLIGTDIESAYVWALGDKAEAYLSLHV